MFSFFKRKIKEETDLSALQCDMHSHILPALDDGSRDITTSIQLVKGLNELGYNKLIATPHIYWDLYKNTPAKIEPAKCDVVQSLKEENVPVALKAAAEYFLDDHVEKLLNNKEPLLTLYDNFVLIEFSFVTAPVNWKECIFDLQMNGYLPVIAHPERYVYFAGSKHIFEEIKNSGCLLQINLLSLTGYYGRAERELAEYLINKNLVSMLGTDVHHQRHLDVLRTGGTFIMPAVKKLLDSGNLLNPTIPVK